MLSQKFIGAALTFFIIPAKAGTQVSFGIFHSEAQVQFPSRRNDRQNCVKEPTGQDTSHSRANCHAKYSVLGSSELNAPLAVSSAGTRATELKSLAHSWSEFSFLATGYKSST